MPTSTPLLQLTSSTVLDDGRAFALLEREANGVSSRDVKEVKRYYGFTDKLLADLLRINLRTYQRQLAAKEAFKPVPTSNLLAVLQVLRYGEEVLGERAALVDWLERPNASLNGQTPISMLHLATGRKLIQDVLTRIDYGVFG